MTIGATYVGVGERIAATRMRSGLSQEQLAGLCGISLSYMKRIEQGSCSVATFPLLLDLAQALKVKDLVDLTGVPLPLMPDGYRRHPATPAVRTAIASYSTPDGEPPDLDDLAARIEHAWQGWQGRSRFRFATLGEALPGLILDARRALAGYANGRRARAAREASTLYQLVRAWTKRVGEFDLSWIAAERALQYAREADDQDLASVSLWNIVAVLGSKGLTTEARSVANQAIDDLEPRLLGAPPQRLSVYGALHLLGALQAARDYDRRAADQHLDVAGRIAAQTGERNDFRTVFGPTNVSIHRALIELELGNPMTALLIAQRTQVDRAPSVERRLVHHLSMARSYTQEGQDVAAVAMLSRMERESPEEVQHSVVVREIIRELVSRETPITAPDLHPLARTAGII